MKGIRFILSAMLLLATMVLLTACSPSSKASNIRVSSTIENFTTVSIVHLGNHLNSLPIDDEQYRLASADIGRADFPVRIMDSNVSLADSVGYSSDSVNSIDEPRSPFRSIFAVVLLGVLFVALIVTASVLVIKHSRRKRTRLFVMGYLCIMCFGILMCVFGILMNSVDSWGAACISFFGEGNGLFGFVLYPGGIGIALIGLVVGSVGTIYCPRCGNDFMTKESEDSSKTVLRCNSCGHSTTQNKPQPTAKKSSGGGVLSAIGGFAKGVVNTAFEGDAARAGWDTVKGGENYDVQLEDGTKLYRQQGTNYFYDGSGNRWYYNEHENKYFRC